MTIASICVRGYKSVRDTGDVSISPAMTIVVGRNNVGKTALLESIAVRAAPGAVHRTINTHTTADVHHPEELTTVLCFKLSKNRIHDLLKQAPEIFTLQNIDNRSPEETASTLTRYVQEGCCIRVTTHMIGNKPSTRTEIDDFAAGGSNFLARIDKETMTVSPVSVASGPTVPFIPWLGKALCQTIYLFRAERLNVAVSGFGQSTELRTDAGNLPEVLNTLQGSNPSRFERLISQVRAIFPDVQRIAVVPGQANQVIITVWDIDPVTERSDLARPLSECGTGLGQVLAILYVAINSDNARTILVDEPQSFLHPGASRKLLEILREYRQHQFIIATHLPSVLSAAQPDLILKLEKRDHETFIESIREPQIDELRMILADLGVRLSDVFGMDRILWVEGKTEESCFPIILGDIVARQSVSTAILTVANTGDFSRKDKQRIINIYTKLSGTYSLLPPTIAFLFDREELSEQRCVDLQKQTAGKVHFLKRRMYENYLLNAEIIADILTKITSKSIREQEVENVIAGWAQRPIREGASREPVLSESELRTVDGAKLLTEIFRRLANIQYDKVKHGVALTRALAQNASGALLEIKDQLTKLLAET
ncbi:AAA family ATPase [Acidiferrobacter thiooxydans]|uniref:AAA family ATPase n=1 Tax=Acidiferrobacter thiooxydans TaxID=163359 RepID=UPI000A06B127|nr:AAA family ATPase [Acidiferrobacter thiooxydans]MDA8119221.1 AAA family ATPase [Gammaproteobacteria bacterium]UEN98427.1 AAA family ATPase [Acidiferrobacter thiooxydans]